jgi:hypothetical protein
MLQQVLSTTEYYLFLANTSGADKTASRALHLMMHGVQDKQVPPTSIAYNIQIQDKQVSLTSKAPMCIGMQSYHTNLVY